MTLGFDVKFPSVRLCQYNDIIYYLKDMVLCPLYLVMIALFSKKTWHLFRLSTLTILQSLKMTWTKDQIMVAKLSSPLLTLPLHHNRTNAECKIICYSRNITGEKTRIFFPL